MSSDKSKASATLGLFYLHGSLSGAGQLLSPLPCCGLPAVPGIWLASFIVTATWPHWSRSGSEPRPHKTVATSGKEYTFSFQNDQALLGNLEGNLGASQTLHLQAFVALG